MTTLLNRDVSILTISVAVAFLSRFFMLVVGRPAFVGWFNHSPYYWVQSKSIIEGGSLAYGDMPLLFALYAALAKGVMMFGVPLEPAIIVTSRLVMSIVPALIPVAVYLMAKRAASGDRLEWPARCIVFASGFLPLTFANMPEHLQKNMMGLLLLALSFLVLFQWLRTGRPGRLLWLFVLLVVICLVHLGSALAALLLAAALTLDRLLSRASAKDLRRVFLLSTGIGLIIVLGIGAFDPSAVARVTDLLAGLVPDGPVSALTSLLLVTFWLVLLLLLWRWFARKSEGKNEATATLARAVILWLGLLAMPLWPGEIGVRLMLFMPLGAVVLLVMLLCLFPARRLFRYASAAVLLVFCAMSIGEAASLLMTYPDKTKIARQLAAVADTYALSSNDLVITPYGVNPIANWFLGTRGALLTAVRRDALVSHDRVFVLNTLERPAPELEPGECRRVRSAEDRYWATRHDSPIGEGWAPDADYDMFDFYRLETWPENWLFDPDGQWAGWGDCAREPGSSP
jgi:hypothetical protein